MNSYMKISLRSITVGLLLVSPLLAADDFRFVKATVENTTLADGTRLKVVPKPGNDPAEITRGSEPAEPDGHWHWWAGQGSGTGAQRGLFSAAGKSGNNAPPLRTTVAGLKPKTHYRVHGFFWIDAAAGKSEPHGEQCWDIRLGLALAEMKGYGYATGVGLPDTIGLTKDSDHLVKQPDAPLRAADGQPAPDTDGSRCLFRALLGVARTDDQGTLIVYADDQAHDSREARTCYEGVGVTEAPAAKADPGAGSAVALNRAARAGDWELMRRELAAGADPNALDAEGRTPLFYLCAVGDYDRAAALIKVGAKPEVAGQTISPLRAAASRSDAKLTKLLLDAGANPPYFTKKADSKATYSTYESAIDWSNFNPVVGAFSSGSVATLKLIMERFPDLDLEKTIVWTAPRSQSDTIQFITRHTGLVKSAIESIHPEMAAYLIGAGYPIRFSEDDNVPSGRVGDMVDDGSHTLMLKAVMNHPPMLEVVAALAKRGVPLIVTKEVAYESVVVPWDALSGAVWEGHADLVAKWLPQAKDAPEDYRMRLATLADAAGKEEVAKLVHQQFPAAKRPPYPHPYNPVERGRARVSGAPGTFQPRMFAPVPHKAAAGVVTLAVIASPDSDGPAAALAAIASNDKAWTVVERGEVDKLIREKSFDRGQSMGTAELSAIGDGLSADLLVMVAKLGGGQADVLRFEAVSVRTGLPIDRLFLAAGEFTPEAFCAEYLPRIRAKFAAQSEAERLTGITLLGIEADRRLPQGATLGNLMQAGLLQAIDDTPGLIALSRDQMAPLAEEKALKDSGGLWGAAWTLEGGIRPGESGGAVLALRLRPLGQKGDGQEVTVAGNPAQPQAMVADAWTQVAKLLEKQPAAVEDPAKRAATEAARLLREAEWMANGPRNWEAAPLADAALYLGADPLKALRLRLQCHWNTRHFWNPRLQFGSIYNPYATGPYPLHPEFHDYARRWLGEHLELLRLTSDTLDRMVAIYQEQPDRFRQDRMKQGGPYADIWQFFDNLIRYRCRLVPNYLNSEQRAMLTEFDPELATLLRKLIPLETNPVKLGELFAAHEHLTHHFLTFPALGPMFAGEIVRAWSAPEIRNAPPLFGEASFFRYRFDPICADVLSNLLEQAMVGRDLPYPALRKAELAYLGAQGSALRAAADGMERAQIAAITSQPEAPSLWVSLRGSAESGSPTLTWAKFPPGCIGTLVASPVACPEFNLNLAAYLEARQRFFLARNPDSPQWVSCRDRITRNLDFDLKNLTQYHGKPAAFDQLGTLAATLDGIFQTQFAATLQPQIDKVRPRSEIGTFGSKGQFPIIADKAALEGGLLTDVRRGVVDQPGLITRAMVDPADHNLLWLAIHPQTVADLPLLPPATGTAEPGTVGCKPPWLLAIDCRDGRLVHKVNLIEAGFGAAAAKDSTLPEIGLFLAPRAVFNDRHLLVKLRWGQDERLVTINRQSGETAALPKLRWVVDYQLVETDGSSFPAMGGIGDAFYVLQDTGEGREERNFGGERILWQFADGKAPRQLNHPGRRPPDSPFDDDDRRPQLLRVDEGKLLIASSWEHAACFDPATNKWIESPERTPQQWRQQVLEIDTRDLRATLFPHHQFVNDDGRVDTFGGQDESKPGCLVFAANGKEARLPVSLAASNSYPGGFMLSAAIPNTSPAQMTAPERVSAADLARSNMVCPVILNQTADHFVLGLRLRTGGVILPVSEPVYLPFLWIIDKKTMRAGMNAQLR